MMIDIVVAPDFTGDFQALYTHMNPLTAGALRVVASADALVFGDGHGHRYTLSGSDLVWGKGLDGTLAVLSGTAFSLSYAEHGKTLVTFADLQTTGAAAWQAFQAEATGRAPGALTDLLVHHCWTYHGTDNADSFAQTELPDRGLLDPRGNDRIFLNGGDDRWFSGAANDTIYGGTGADSLYGGADNDQLYGGAGADLALGGAGNDVLYGAAGADFLWGNDGNDSLYGGMGDDTLRSGAGDDLVTGGDGADLFIFATGSGHDVVSDYAVGHDHLQITTSAQIEVIAQGADTLIRFGSDEVLLTGVEASQISAADFL